MNRPTLIDWLVGVLLALLTGYILFTYAFAWLFSQMIIRGTVEEVITGLCVTAIFYLGMAIGVGIAGTTASRWLRGYYPRRTRR